MRQLWTVIISSSLIFNNAFGQEYRYVPPENKKNVISFINRTMVDDSGQWQDLNKYSRFTTDWEPFTIKAPNPMPDYRFIKDSESRITNYLTNQFSHLLELDESGDFFFPKWSTPHLFYSCMVVRSLYTADHRVCNSNELKDCSFCRFTDYQNIDLLPLWKSTSDYKKCMEENQNPGLCLFDTKRAHFWDHRYKLKSFWYEIKKEAFRERYKNAVERSRYEGFYPGVN
jgi:hypothetical protein